MIDEQPVFDRKSDFQSVIGYRGSLAQTIEQLKWQRFILAVDCLS